MKKPVNTHSKTENSFNILHEEKRLCNEILGREPESFSSMDRIRIRLKIMEHHLLTELCNGILERQTTEN